MVRFHPDNVHLLIGDGAATSHAEILTCLSSQLTVYLCVVAYMLLLYCLFIQVRVTRAKSLSGTRATRLLSAQCSAPAGEERRHDLRCLTTAIFNTLCSRDFLCAQLRQGTQAPRVLHVPRPGRERQRQQDRVVRQQLGAHHGLHGRAAVPLGPGEPHRARQFRLHQQRARAAVCAGPGQSGFVFWHLSDDLISIIIIAVVDIGGHVGEEFQRWIAGEAHQRVVHGAWAGGGREKGESRAQVQVQVQVHGVML